MVGGLLLTFLLTLFAADTRNQSHGSAIHYYIQTKATLEGDEFVEVIGATNLPAGALLLLHIYDYLGEGSQILSEEITATVDRHGLFRAEIHAKKGRKFRANLVCHVLFMPNYPNQLKSLLAIVGPRGEHLYSGSYNPQLGQGSGEHYYLEDLTVVTE